VKKSAFDTVKKQGLSSCSRQLRWIVEGLVHFWFALKGDDMNTELTPEKLAELGKMLEGALVPCLSVEERLAGLKPEEILSVLEPEKILSVLKPEDRLAGLSAEEIEAYLNKLKNN
jgi:UPF0288 family protein (methanogenesis marker protein 3)